MPEKYYLKINYNKIKLFYHGYLFIYWIHDFRKNLIPLIYHIMSISDNRQTLTRVCSEF